MSYTQFRTYMLAKAKYKFNNYKTLVIRVDNAAEHSSVDKRTEPLKLFFESFTYYNVLTNASCSLTTSYVEVEVKCHWTSCNTTRIRPSLKQQNAIPLTVLDGLGPSGHEFSMLNQQWFLSTFINASYTPWNYMWTTEKYSTPLEYYFTNPNSPYSAMAVGGEAWPGAAIWPVGDVVFSQRFTQLLNTYWIVSIAPFSVTGNFVLEESTNSSRYVTYTYRNVTGTMTPDHLVLHCNRAWLSVLVIASTVMLIAGVAAAILTTLRKGPDILDRTTSLLRDNPYALVGHTASMEDALDQARRLKDVKVCLGDVRSEQDVGHVALGTTDVVLPMIRLRRGRLYE